MKRCLVCNGKGYAKGLCRKHYYQRPEVKEQQREYQQRPERAERALLLARISELRKKISELKERKRRSFVLEERLACYERAFELNFIDNKFKAGNPVIPKCAINAGKKELWGDKE